MNQQITKFREVASFEEIILLDRAINTLYGNIIEHSSEDINSVFKWYKGIAPSPSTYKGVWNWDAAFHMIAMSYFDKDIAQDQARIMFESQCDNGQLADVIYSSGKRVDKFTKPPVFAYAIQCSYIINPDGDFLSYCYLYLKRNLIWWENYRYDGNLFSYKVSPMESGWDNSVRFDFPNRIAWLYSIDLNSYMVSFYHAMKYIAIRIGNNSEANIYHIKSKDLVAKINAQLYDSSKGCYQDYNKILKKFTNHISPASFMPLYFGFSTTEQSVKLHNIASDNRYFYPGIPTIAYNDNKYQSHRYWRGPCWLNTAYFTIRGLYNYGYRNTANEMSSKIIKWCMDNKDAIYEYYDSVTGKGLGAKDFGWSSVFIIELLLLKYDLQII